LNKTAKAKVYGSEFYYQHYGTGNDTHSHVVDAADFGGNLCRIDNEFITGSYANSGTNAGICYQIIFYRYGFDVIGVLDR
jgi:hypothetical protein